ncbi:MAG TPA: hypothetical protein PKX30_01415 [Candidatus Pacearchaeota archaeon]|nr:hypothetical protein [Candidatus Pacearchaeota archaeon]
MSGKYIEFENLLIFVLAHAQAIRINKLFELRDILKNKGICVDDFSKESLEKMIDKNQMICYHEFPIIPGRIIKRAKNPETFRYFDGIQANKITFDRGVIPIVAKNIILDFLWDNIMGFKIIEDNDFLSYILFRVKEISVCDCHAIKGLVEEQTKDLIKFRGCDFFCEESDMGNLYHDEKRGWVLRRAENKKFFDKDGQMEKYCKMWVGNIVPIKDMVAIDEFLAERELLNR